MQWNLSIADTLYSGHLVIADTFSRNWTNHRQTLIEKPLYSGHFYSGHLVIADTFFWKRVDISYISYLSIADTLIFLGKNKMPTKKIIFSKYVFTCLKKLKIYTLVETFIHSSCNAIIYFFNCLFNPSNHPSSP